MRRVSRLNAAAQDLDVRFDSGEDFSFGRGRQDVEHIQHGCRE